MMTDDEVTRILRQNRIVFDPKMKASQFAGAAPFLAFLNKAKLRTRLESEFGSFRSRTMVQTLIGIILGARNMNDVGKAGKDDLISSFLKNPVEEAQLGRDVRDWNPEEIQRFHDFNTSLAIYDLAQRVSQNELLVFDIDATSVEKYGHQEGVEHGYVGKDEPEKCYQYLFLRLANRNTFFYGTIRGGSAHSQNDFCGYLKRFFPNFKNRWKSALRADSGYYNEEAFEILSENDASFYIKAPMSPQRLLMAQTSPDLHWTEANEFGESFSSRVTNTKKGTKYLEVFKRRPDESNQMDLFSQGSFHYDCIASNDFEKLGEDIFSFYNQRANIENNIKEIKSDYALGKIVTDSFAANDVITQVTMMAYILMTHFKNECLPAKYQRCFLSTIRSQIFNMIGKFFTDSHQLYCRMKNVFCDARVYGFIFEQVRRLRSWVLEPPDISAIAA
jgi:hypothetical protein